MSTVGMWFVSETKKQGSPPQSEWPKNFTVCTKRNIMESRLPFPHWFQVGYFFLNVFSAPSKYRTCYTFQQLYIYFPGRMELNNNKQRPSVSQCPLPTQEQTCEQIGAVGQPPQSVEKRGG